MGQTDGHQTITLHLPLDAASVIMTVTTAVFKLFGPKTHIFIIRQKKRNGIYIAPFILSIVSKRSDMDHTVLPANYTMPALPL